MSTTELPTLSPAQRQVASVLAEVHDVTIVDITTAAGVSKSTVTKTLALLESAGVAARTIHTDGETRLADTWSPTSLTGQVLVSTALAGGPGYGHAEKLLNTTADGTVSDTESETPDAADTDEHHASGTPTKTSDACGTASDQHNESSDAKPFAVPTGGAGRERLAPGGLGQMVADVLAEHPFTEYTPTELSHLLGGRSSGAISNALERQVKTGSVKRTCERPRRYQHADATAVV